MNTGRSPRKSAPKAALTRLIMFKHLCDIHNAPLFWKWVTERSGVAVWRSLSLSNPGQTWSTPAITEDGKPTGRPHWSAESEPYAVYTDPQEIGVITYLELKRFHVATRPVFFGLKLTGASCRKLERSLRAAGEGATYSFDYDTQECVILVPDQTLSLLEWANQNGNGTMAAQNGNGGKGDTDRE